jgi:hypothetical protein
VSWAAALGMRIGLAACLAVFAALPGPAAAQMIPRAEKGAVPLIAAGDLPTGHVAVVGKGEAAWTERYHPAKAARLLDEAPARARPAGLRGVAAGTVLFGYQLRGGYAYCPRLDYSAARRDVQCFRDLDGDGTFDAGYVTDLRGLDSQVLAAFVHLLQPVRKLRYETVDPEQSFIVESRWLYDGVRDGKPSFRVSIDQDVLPTRRFCEPADDGVCVVAGRRLSVSAEGQKTRIELLPGSVQTSLNVYMVGGPSIPSQKPKSGS